MIAPGEQHLKSSSRGTTIMKNTLIFGLAIAALTQTLNAQAAVDTKYPAANFEPSVIYIDKDATASPEPVAAASEFDAKYPAANFQPKVVYFDQDLAGQKQASSAPEPTAAQDEADPKYPAAYFKPKVIYP